MFIKVSKDVEFRIFWKHRNPNDPKFNSETDIAGTTCFLYRNAEEYLIGISILKENDHYNRKIGIWQSFKSLMRSVKRVQEKEVVKAFWNKFLEEHKPLKK